ncbi:MAG: phage/plasmid primase, P4 family [Actinomycetota bacterium]|nr:phage/plasmid primase, P4 family [Actinomycetota bacterium]
MTWFDPNLVPVNGGQQDPPAPAARPAPPAPPDAQQWPLTDAGNAERFAYYNRHAARWVSQWQKWIVWDGGRWQTDTHLRIDRLAVETARRIPDDVDADDKHGRKKVLRWATGSENTARLSAMIRQARGLLAVSSSSLDADPWAFNCASGTIDLRSGGIRPHNPDDLITKISPLPYEPDAQALAWQVFLDEIMDGDREVIDFLHRATGYSLTGLTGEEMWFLAEGGGANGKSTFLKVIRAVLGDYARNAADDTFTHNGRFDASRIPNDIARLQGARFVTVVETGVGRRLDETLVKRVVSGDPLTARYLHQEYFEYLPSMKVWMATNKLPQIHGGDEGIWRRTRRIPFHVSIPPERRITDYDQRLLDEEGPAILSWLVRGCTAWRARRLADHQPSAIADATQAYRENADVLGGYLDEACEVGNLDDAEGATDLYKSYRRWCDDVGERPMSQKAFGAALQERGFTHGPRDPNTRRKTYLGIKLRPSWRTYGGGRMPI